jgi:hypothetical protein
MGAGAGSRQRDAATDLRINAQAGDVTRTQRIHSYPRSHDNERQRTENIMNESLKVHAHHLERAAYLYVRQSSMRQVLENVESAKRQYALRAGDGAGLVR